MIKWTAWIGVIKPLVDLEAYLHTLDFVHVGGIVDGILSPVSLPVARICGEVVGFRPVHVFGLPCDLEYIRNGPILYGIYYDGMAVCLNRFLKWSKSGSRLPEPDPCFNEVELRGVEFSFEAFANQIFKLPELFTSLAALAFKLFYLVRKLVLII